MRRVLVYRVASGRIQECWVLDARPRVIGHLRPSPLLRLRRDIDAAGSHVMFSPMVIAGLGRELAGIPGPAFPFLPAPT